MTTTDINPSAQQMWSTWCARRHSYKCVPRSPHVDTPKSNSTWRARGHSLKIQRDELRGTYVVARIDLHISTVAIPWQLPHLLHNRNYSKTRPLKLNSFHIILSLYTGRIHSFYYHHFFFFWHELLNYRLQFINTIWNRKQITQGRRGKERKGVHQLQKRQLWHSSLENLSSISISPTLSCFSSGRFSQ